MTRLVFSSSTPISVHVRYWVNTTNTSTRPITDVERAAPLPAGVGSMPCTGTGLAPAPVRRRAGATSGPEVSPPTRSHVLQQSCRLSEPAAPPE